MDSNNSIWIARTGSGEESAFGYKPLAEAWAGKFGTVREVRIAILDRAEIASANELIQSLEAALYEISDCYVLDVARKTASRAIADIEAFRNA
jgi:hypothetical protein